MATVKTQNYPQNDTEMNSIELDITDIEILRILQKDSNLSIRDIQAKLQDRNRKIGERDPALALEIKTSLGTIHNRINKLRDLGIIKGYTIILDAEKLGYDLTVMIQMQIDVNKLNEVNKSFATISELVAMYNITGDFDLVCFGRFKCRRHLNQVLREKILPNPYVRRTATSIALNILKENFSALNIFEEN